MRSLNPSHLKDYQRRAGLVADGILGPVTRAALAADEAARQEPKLDDFRGSLGLLVQLEGYRGEPYWPGGRSGVTLDYGYDLGSHSADELLKHYGGLWDTAKLAELAGAVHLAGADAERWLRAHPPSRWPISRVEAAQILPGVAVPYWEAAKWAWRGVLEAPGPIQAAALSIVFNGWLAPLRVILPHLERRKWQVAAQALRTLEPASRRMAEADLIETAGQS